MKKGEKIDIKKISEWCLWTSHITISFTRSRNLLNNAPWCLKVVKGNLKSIQLKVNSCWRSYRRKSLALQSRILLLLVAKCLLLLALCNLFPWTTLDYVIKADQHSKNLFPFKSCSCWFWFRKIDWQWCQFFKNNQIRESIWKWAYKYKRKVEKYGREALNGFLLHRIFVCSILCATEIVNVCNLET